MLTALDKVKAYSDFTASRDRCAEKILNWYLGAMDILMEKTKRKVAAFAAHVRPELIERELGLTAYQTHRLMVRLRETSYRLAYHGEVQAIHNALGKSRKGPHKADRGQAPSGGDLDQRVLLAFDRLKRKVEDALQYSELMGEKTAEIAARVERAFPRTRPAPSGHTQALSQKRKRHREAASPFRADVITSGEWYQILQDYMANELPSDIFDRSPGDNAAFFDADSQMNAERYEWEIEQEATEDFVRQVRDGAIQAARDNGISDFLWNAVLDSKTDECCDVRDGKTSAEIEAELEQGPIDEDGCEAIVAPAHFNCRCKSVPMSDDVPDSPVVDSASFDDWLAEKAQSD